MNCIILVDIHDRHEIQEFPNSQKNRKRIYFQLSTQIVKLQSKTQMSQLNKGLNVIQSTGKRGKNLEIFPRFGTVGSKLGKTNQRNRG